MDHEFILNTPEQLQALAHPTRHRILHYLVEHTATNQQIAIALGDPPARVHFHLRELWSAGLVLLVEERAKSGILEKYYRAVAQSFRLGEAFQFGPGARGQATDALGLSLLSAAEHDLQRSVARSAPAELHPLISAHFQGPLSPEAVERVQQWVARIGQEFDREATTAHAAPFTLTLLLHPLPDAPEGMNGDAPPLG